MTLSRKRAAAEASATMISLVTRKNSFDSTLLEREQAIAQREQALDIQTRQLSEREQAGAASAAALEESLALAREQLVAAYRRAERLEATLQERDTECGQLRIRMGLLEASCAGSTMPPPQPTWLSAPVYWSITPRRKRAG
jgi:hypothetical protein